MFGACLWPFTFYVFNLKLEHGRISVTCPTRHSVLPKWMAIRKTVQIQTKIHRQYGPPSLCLQLLFVSPRFQDILWCANYISYLIPFSWGSNTHDVRSCTEQYWTILNWSNKWSYQETNQFGRWCFLTVYHPWTKRNRRRVLASSSCSSSLVTSAEEELSFHAVPGFRGTPWAKRADAWCRKDVQTMCYYS